LSVSGYGRFIQGADWKEKQILRSWRREIYIVPDRNRTLDMILAKNIY